jgi:hypothetical protein
MIESELMKESKRPRELMEYWKYNVQFMRDHPDYFNPDGLVVFCGPQGSGKTMSAVNYVYRLMERYPLCKLVTNIELLDYPVVSFTEYCERYKTIFEEEIKGVIHTYQKYQLEEKKCGLNIWSITGFLSSGIMMIFRGIPTVKWALSS